MTLIAIDGQIGAGGPQLGRRVARMLGLTYVDRLVLPGLHEVAARAPSLRPRFSDRMRTLLEKAIMGFALGNAAGDPYFTAPELVMLPLTWDLSDEAPRASAAVSAGGGPHSFEALLRQGKSVLVHRAGAVALPKEQVLRVGLFGAWEDRVDRLMRHEGLTRRTDAEARIRQREQAQADYFATKYSANPEDESLYDLCINTSREQINLASVRIARALQGMSAATA